MHQYRVRSNGAVALSGGVAKTLWQWTTPSSRRARPLTIMIGGLSTSPSDPPVVMELRLQGNAGTSSSFTPTILDRSDPASLSSALNNFSVEPSDLGELYGPIPCTPVGGLFIYNFASSLADEHIIVGTSTRVGLVVNSPNPLSGVYSYGIWQE